MVLSDRIVCIYSIRILHAPPGFSLRSVLASPRCRIHLRRGVHEPVRPPRPGPGPSFGAISPVPKPPLFGTSRVSRSSAQKTTMSKRRCVAARSIACSSARAARCCPTRTRGTRVPPLSPALHALSERLLPKGDPTRNLTPRSAVDCASHRYGLSVASPLVELPVCTLGAAIGAKWTPPPSQFTAIEGDPLTVCAHTRPGL